MRYEFNKIVKEISANEKQLTIEQSKAIEQSKEMLIAKMDSYGIKPKDELVFEAMVKFLAEVRIGLRREGLLLYGGVGTGKTVALKIISADTGYEFYNADELVLLHAQNENLFWEVMKKQNNIIIDDLGCEQVRNDYGSKFELLGQVLQLRYRLWESLGSLTLISTNLDGEAIKARYTERLYSRVKHMCESVNTGKHDLRNNKKTGDTK